MTRMRRMATCLGLAAALALPAAALADPWKDESGQGRGGGEGRGGGPALVVPIPVPVPQGHYGPPPGRDAEPRIPQGHMPSPGECRVWIPGVPAGQQPPPGRC